MAPAREGNRGERIDDLPHGERAEAGRHGLRCDDDLAADAGRAFFSTLVDIRKSLYYELGEKHRSAIVSLTQNLKISANNSLQFSLSREKTFDRYQSEAKLLWNWYL